MVSDESIIDFTLFKLTTTYKFKLMSHLHFLLDDKHCYTTK